MQVQIAGLQTLRTVAQAGSTEQPRGESYAWALLLLHKLAGDVTSIVYNAIKVSLLLKVVMTVLCNCLVYIIQSWLDPCRGTEEITGSDER